MALFEDKAPGILALLMQDFALTLEDAAALLGNAGEESGGFALLQEQSPIGGGAGGWGWMQWTGPRRALFMGYSSRGQFDPASDKANYGFLFTELKGVYSHVLGSVRAAVSLADKVAAFMNGYEMPNAAYAHLDVREAYANRAIAAYNAAPQPVAPLFSTVPAPKPPPSTTTPAPKPAPLPVPPPKPPAPAPGPTKGTSVFNLAGLLGLVSGAPTIIGGGITLIEELVAGYNQAKATPNANLLTYVEDMMQQLLANKGAVASAILGPEPVVTASGTVVPPKA